MRSLLRMIVAFEAGLEGSNMIRTSVGVVAGGVVWWFGFRALAVLTFASWPQYAAQAKVFMAGGAYGMTLPMSVCDFCSTGIAAESARAGLPWRSRAGERLAGYWPS